MGFRFQDCIWRYWNNLRNKNIAPQCKDYQISPFKIWGRPGYESTLISSGPAQPEFTVIVPRGMTLINDFNSTKLTILPDYDLGIGKPYVTRNDGKECYNIIADESYKDAKDELGEESIELLLSYKVVNKHKFYLIPIFAFVLVYMGYKGLKFVLNSNSLNNDNSIFTFLFTYLILQISYLTLYLTLRRDNYEIPFNFLIIPSIIFSTVLLIACFYYMPMNHFITTNNTTLI